MGKNSRCSSGNFWYTILDIEDDDVTGAVALTLEVAPNPNSSGESGGHYAVDGCCWLV